MCKTCGCSFRSRDFGNIERFVEPCILLLLSQKLAVVLSTSQVETNWNAFRLANLALSKGDMVTMFLTGEGVEYEQMSSPQFNIKEQVGKFLQADNARIVACGTCIAIRKQGSTQECPEGGIEDLYKLVADSDKVITF